MKKIILLIASSISLTACGNDDVANGMQYEFPECGISQRNEKNIKKICATQDSIAKKVSKDYTPKFLQILVGAGHTSNYSRGRSGLILDFENQELDLQGHVWDFSKQGFPVVELRGHDTTVQNGILLNTYLSLGGNYISPNFSTNTQINNYAEKYGFLYAKEYSSGTYQGNIENFYFKNMKNYSDTLELSSWGGGILSSQFIIEKNIYISGSKATIIQNKIISKTKLGVNTTLSKDKAGSNKSRFTLTKTNSSKLIDKSQQIFPDKNNDTTAIPNALYIKFSPDTIIDGNTFTLTQKNDQAYAIILDHSPRVRITNNTFNGFKVPILMDQWSSIVNDKGKEIRPEQFTGYGNIINPNKFAGHVTMNRKGEIVEK
ncbi:hypothetical protein [Acinetobacter oleivorans]|uniref:hypothetical protein n=1 Tax=Acinetobacter oleivorans TaxID=1148157 RepID=UPI00124FF040|nr:hypothetical protein [Acinetobacter oleivorans]